MIYFGCFGEAYGFKALSNYLKSLVDEK